MKLKETSSNAQPKKVNGIHNHDKQDSQNFTTSTNKKKQVKKTKEKLLTHKQEDLEIIGENHIATSIETPLRKDAFELDDDTKIEKIAVHFKEIMDILGLDLTDDSLQGTPKRVAKMYVQEIFKGLNPENKPATKMFENKFGYNQLLVEKNISFHSHCEHHFVPIHGKAHIAYISNEGVIGLSKLHRIVDYFARRPQVQERLTNQIGEELKKMLGTEDIAVVLDAAHMCVSMRGIKDQTSTTITSFYSGKFNEEATRTEFLKYIQ
ncbi:GTP cyclohydrolase I [Bernardetia litoralis DSM 6794]|uniref:GTP cyclohydrolase 1 n=1 Tax=Bernardetia litoralis (strain ATCC 23117 / DSM 6794 / NBRC 15988 / NCIMB 1366 / Fx l1 / Sio-4) TaxID=880071 RepID=I4AMN4_BERLS|nr:GTP cyclohydrolase I FolE [Bernardetia litoralis]AFM05219.1 GTP cyclohydrolase I [Bernardetia litoralis DSM 6794]